MKRTKSPATEATNPATPALKLRERILGHLETLRIVLPAGNAICPSVVKRRFFSLAVTDSGGGFEFPPGV